MWVIESDEAAGRTTCQLAQAFEANVAGGDEGFCWSMGAVVVGTRPSEVVAVEVVKDPERRARLTATRLTVSADGAAFAYEPSSPSTGHSTAFDVPTGDLAVIVAADRVEGVLHHDLGTTAFALPPEYLAAFEAMLQLCGARPSPP